MFRSTRIAIVTSMDPLPASDRALANALEKRGRSVSPELWRSPHVHWEHFDLIIIRSCWDYHLRPAQFLEWIAYIERLGKVVLNPPELIRWNVDKTYLKDLEACGVAVPDTVWIEPGRTIDVSAVCLQRGWNEAVSKPTVSASAYQTRRSHSGSVYGPCMIQEYLTSIETMGEWSLVYFDSEFSHAVRKIPAPGEFRVQSQFGGTVSLEHPPTTLLAFAERVLTSAPASSVAARVDVVEHQGNPLLMELELIEPELFLDLAESLSDRLAAIITDRLP